MIYWFEIWNAWIMDWWSSRQCLTLCVSLSLNHSKCNETSKTNTSAQETAGKEENRKKIQLLYSYLDVYQLVAKQYELSSFVPPCVYSKAYPHNSKHMKIVQIDDFIAQDLIHTHSHLVALELLSLLLLEPSSSFVVAVFIVVVVGWCCYFSVSVSVSVSVYRCSVAEVVIVVCITAVRVERVHDCYQTINFYMVGYLKSAKGLNGWT